MKNLKTKLTKFAIITITSLVVVLGANQLMSFCISEAGEFGQKLGREGNLYSIVNYGHVIPSYSLNVPKAKAYEKEWAYNEVVPRKVSEEYIENNEVCKLAGVDLIKSIISCENTEWDNTLKTRLEGTAVGLAQYTIGTWYETESWKAHKKARTDFKASIDEMCEDVLIGEIWRWNASKHCWK